MSTSAVSASSLQQELQTYFQQRTSDLQQLGQALQSGNLAGAQQAYSTLQTLAQGSPFAAIASPGTANAFLASPREQAFTAIGQALQSGDIATAQQAFAQLQNTFSFNHQNGNGGVIDPPGPAVIVNIGGSSSSSSTTSSVNTSTNSSTTSTNSTSSSPEIILNLANSDTPEQITIGFTNSANGEQLTIGVSSQQSQSPQEITLNLPQNSNEQIVLNLLNADSTSSSQSGSVNAVA